MDKRARELFSQAIAQQRNGETELAQRNAQECIRLLAPLDSAEETAAGAVVVVDGRKICEPDFLHVGTARQRFDFEGINV